MLITAWGMMWVPQGGGCKMKTPEIFIFPFFGGSEILEGIGYPKLDDESHRSLKLGDIETTRSREEITLKYPDSRKIIRFFPQIYGREYPRAHRKDIPPEADLIISSSWEDHEDACIRWKEHKPLIARYSGFYGGVSSYSKKLPEEAGYSLDIPPDPKILFSLLDSKDFLQGIMERDEKKIRVSLSDLTRDIPLILSLGSSGLPLRPVIATPFLTEVCKKVKEMD